jgi:hypothetical protein
MFDCFSMVNERKVRVWILMAGSLLQLMQTGVGSSQNDVLALLSLKMAMNIDLVSASKPAQLK